MNFDDYKKIKYLIKNNKNDIFVNKLKIMNFLKKIKINLKVILTII